MTRVLLDINVVLDVLQKRKNHYESSSLVLSLCADKVIQGYISSISYSILDYLLTKEIGASRSREMLQKIRTITAVADVDEKVIDFALKSKFKDFEDAIQYYSMITPKLTHLITRNKKDFIHARSIVVTPEEFLVMASLN
ncbi:MAG: PIN domain-containing protein [Deltaproteobacteria bacterium]|nr:PIN domain-containing protein [Deltaproteobacteria bacterium]